MDRPRDHDQPPEVAGRHGDHRERLRVLEPRLRDLQLHEPPSELIRAERARRATAAGGTS